LMDKLDVFFEDVGDEIKPSVLHGDLWSGGWGAGGGGCRDSRSMAQRGAAWLPLGLRDGTAATCGRPDRPWALW
jgi:hypothetical protein